LGIGLFAEGVPSSTTHTNRSSYKSLKMHKNTTKVNGKPRNPKFTENFDGYVTRQTDSQTERDIEAYTDTDTHTKRQTDRDEEALAQKRFQKMLKNQLSPD